MKRRLVVFALALVFTSFPVLADPPDRYRFYALQDTTGEKDKLNEFIDELVEDIQSEIEEIAREHEEMNVKSDQEADQDTKNGAVTFSGKTEVQPEDTIHGDVVVKGGTLVVAGTIMGDALVVNGDIHVRDGGKITGNARAINGEVIREKDGFIGGYVEETTSSKDVSYSKKRIKPRPSYRFNDYWLGEYILPDDFLFRYNRVEAFFIGIGSQKKFYWDGKRIVSGYGSAGYSFGLHRWRLNLGLDRQFAIDGALYEIGVEGHSLTDTKDEWIMRLSENNLVAFFWHEDYRDYFSREGFSAHVARYSQEPGLSTQITLEYAVDKYSSLSQNTNWSLFRQSHHFRSNPAVNEGTMHSVVGAAGLSTMELQHQQMAGWNLYARGEIGNEVLGGAFEFKHVLVDLRRFQPFTGYDNMNVRLRAGSLEGDYLMQRTFELGGANTIPAFGFKEFSGNRMILGNIEYIVSGRLLDDVAIWPRSMNFILFADAGATALANTRDPLYEGFETITFHSFKSDFGFALGWSEERWRLGFAWRTDIASPVSVFLRLNRPF